LATAEQQVRAATTQEGELTARLRAEHQRLVIATACNHGTLDAINNVVTAQDVQAGVDQLTSHLAQLTQTCTQPAS
jgi:hypothetical protein